MLKALGSVVQTWSPASGRIAPGDDPLRAIASAWPGIVGETVARNSQPLELERGVLVVATRSSAWSQQLQMLSETVLSEIAQLEGVAVDRLVFRSGRLRAATPVPRLRPQVARVLPGRALGKPPAQTAGDERDAFERLKKRVTALRRSAGALCPGCAAPSPGAGVCAPCRVAAEAGRQLEAQRMMYSGSSIDFEMTRLHVEGLTREEYEGARRHVLRRWREMLERARLRGRLSRDGLERRLAGSYVLVQSRLPPERITTAIVRNALGEALYAFLYETAAPGAG